MLEILNAIEGTLQPLKDFQHKTSTLPPMVPKGIQPKLHLSSLLMWARKDTLVVNNLASVLQVIQLMEQHSQVMVFP